ncbi:LOW QUALITY PROTEIN: hypothetical protein RJ639_043370 [Escallonia herrerae]|uniref:Legume lectin domain-containing protein n=1 Tax=Escallonia herrerae TaxID=1293975 RepID=A0AA88WCF4_9ASTE|nr:LOW QUALITY PROTEIN: hypothetical protein RJ639_043370 [Escallonia herrerae]
MGTDLLSLLLRLSYAIQLSGWLFRPLSLTLLQIPSGEWNHPLGHVVINKNSISSANHTAWNASLHSGDTADAWITYNATIRNVAVFWNYKANPELRISTISYLVDLKENMERHMLHSWEFRSSLAIRETGGKDAKKVRLIGGFTVSVTS